MMQLTPEQVKGRIKNIAKQNHADPRVLMRIYMMERLLERIAVSEHKDNFVIKGGMLVTAMVGIALRSTMDIDASIKNKKLSKEDVTEIFERIKDIDIDDGVAFEIEDISDIMSEMEYPGVRISMNAIMGKLITPMKIDVSTGDVITPRAVEYEYKLLLGERSINLWSYNLETVLAEKMQTILARGILNTRMRDFYDVHILLLTYGKRIDNEVLKQAFDATCKKRGTVSLKDKRMEILRSVVGDERLKGLWNTYQKKYPYATDIQYDDIMQSVAALANII